MDLSEPILIGQRSIFLFWPLAIPIAKDVLTYHLLLIAFHVFPSRSAFSSLHLCSKNQKPVFEPGIKLEGLLLSVTFRKLGLANWGALNRGCKGFFFTFPFCLPTWSNLSFVGLWQANQRRAAPKNQFPCQHDEYSCSSIMAPVSRQTTRRDAQFDLTFLLSPPVKPKCTP